MYNMQKKQGSSGKMTLVIAGAAVLAIGLFVWWVGQATPDFQQVEIQTSLEQ
ncbi:MAG: hypothetical protein OXR68_01455 [Alphaproteobacteria bacterium]|nr:hypothetical protein [Alphaproteobacteria bacterium]MDD9919278.1 hypothetical protein [Alphaproteobacteria bacterium]